jgi:hypothetical protein
VSFGIAAIITDMIAKFLMFAKSLDRMDALLSQNPFGTCLPTPMPFLACRIVHGHVGGCGCGTANGTKLQYNTATTGNVREHQRDPF